MKFVIKHEIKGRLRVHMAQQRMTYEQADVLQYYLQQSDLVVDAKVYEQTADVVISYNGDRAAMIHLLCTFKYQMVEVPEGYLESTGRELNSEYKEKLICKVVWHPLYMEGSAESASPSTGCGGSGCNGDCGIIASSGYGNGRFCHVPAWHRRAVRRVDAQEVRRRPCAHHVFECRQSMAEEGRRGGSCRREGSP